MTALLAYLLSHGYAVVLYAQYPTVTRPASVRMAVDSIRRGRGFHKRRHRPHVARAELEEAAKTVVRDTVEPPLVRRQGKGKDGGGKGGE